jgi:hypothetical protein
MAIIRIKRTTGNLLPEGLTFGELAFVGASGGYTANRLYIAGPEGTCIWVGAQILNQPTYWSGATAETTIPTVSAVDGRIQTQVSTNSVASFNGITGAVQGVSALGISGDWRTSGVVAYGGPTGGITLAGATWSGQSAPVLNSISVWGITSGTVLTGKTPMEILEIMLVQYLNPTLSGLNMGFVPASGSGTTSLAIGMTADNDSSNISWSNTNGSNISNGATLSASLSSGMSGDSGNLLTTQQITSATANSYTGFNPTVKYKGTTLASSSQAANVSFTLSAKSTQNTTISTSQTYFWYPRIFYGWSTDSTLTYPPDSWKRPNVLSGLTTGSLMTTINSTNPNFSFTLPAPSTDSYLYFWIHSNFIPNKIMDSVSGGNEWALTTTNSGTLVGGITLDDGVTTQTYRGYRSQYLLVGDITVSLRGS